MPDECTTDILLHRKVDPLNNQLMPQVIIGDERRLKQVLINLIKNALKFTKSGFVKVMACYNDDTEMLVIHVLDSGRGISHEDI